MTFKDWLLLIAISFMWGGSFFFNSVLIEAVGDPTSTLLEEGVYSANKRNELTWTFTLAPGGEKTLTYRYSVLVNV